MNSFSLSSLAPADKGLQFCFDSRGEILLAWKSSFICNTDICVFLIHKILLSSASHSLSAASLIPLLVAQSQKETIVSGKHKNSLIINGL